jgi:hypothetical protein
MVMDRASWLWRRKSSDNNPGANESSVPVSSHSGRYLGDQVLPPVLNCVSWKSFDPSRTIFLLQQLQVLIIVILQLYCFFSLSTTNFSIQSLYVMCALEKTFVL